MASPDAAIKVGGSRKKARKSKSKGRNNNTTNNEGVRRSGKKGSRFPTKLKLFSCMALGGSKDEEGSSSGGNFNNNHERNSTYEYDNAKDLDADPLSSRINNSRTAGSPPPNLLLFTFNELRLGTDNFKQENVLGVGGFGPVYKGTVSHHESSPISSPGSRLLDVAVKRLNTEGRQGHQEWEAEVTHLGPLQHPNLVKLVGYCIDGEQRLLVYEFMPGGSVDNHLFSGGVPLAWHVRMKIMLGAARGLAFLHEGIEKPIIYRDFKTNNILLDLDFNAKLSDFGLAKDAPVGDMTHVSTQVLKGTHGYIAPEAITGRLNYKCDVYSFGVVLLEMLTGRRARDDKRPQMEKNLVEWVESQRRHGIFGGCWGRYNDFHNMMDPRLGRKYSTRGAYKAIRLATRCVCHDPKKRPLMSEVVNVLKSLPECKDKSCNNSTSSSHGGGENKYGLKVGSPSGSAASFSSSGNTVYTPPFLSPEPSGGM